MVRDGLNLPSFEKMATPDRVEEIADPVRLQETEEQTSARKQWSESKKPKQSYSWGPRTDSRHWGGFTRGLDISDVGY
ncbi:hypothetical protein RJ639_046268 [Escallonia herrerae]|uniref:Uncharacterized protein n=1 Tax=Escallonia herrerae TaxID=1293975 RepID=A0AA88WDE8_9ASTE|nr:hypothetical protein RJ639_046268 [Escallonia herrerae]